MDLGSRDTSWTPIPTDELLTELFRRQQDGDGDARPQCGSGKQQSYDTGLHVGALLLILSLSTISCGIPVLPRRRSTGRLHKRIIFYCQHFGTGVLLATAFVHLLPTAFLSLTDPCLPYFFNKGFPQLAGVVAMTAALSVVAVEQYLAIRGARHSHSHDYHYWEDDDDSSEHAHRASTLPSTNGTNSNGLAARRAGGHRPSDIALDNLESSEGLIRGASPLYSAHSSQPQTPGPSVKLDPPHDTDGDDTDIELDAHELDPMSNGHAPVTGKSVQTPTTPAPVTPEEQARLLRQCLMLEGGILFHSIFIGMAISVATGSTFIVFLIAISFHQTFEGLALGSRIAAIQLPRHSARPWLMVLAFGLTTPIGQAIGLIVHNLYDPLGQTGLLMVGFMNSISAGLLLFAGLVQLLSEDFLTEKSYCSLTGRKRWRAYLAVVGGATLMAVVGGFA